MSNVDIQKVKPLLGLLAKMGFISWTCRTDIDSYIIFQALDKAYDQAINNSGTPGQLFISPDQYNAYRKAFTGKK